MSEFAAEPARHPALDFVFAHHQLRQRSQGAPNRKHDNFKNCGKFWRFCEKHHGESRRGDSERKIRRADLSKLGEDNFKRAWRRELRSHLFRNDLKSSGEFGRNWFAWRSDPAYSKSFAENDNKSSAPVWLRSWLSDQRAVVSINLESRVTLHFESAIFILPESSESSKMGFQIYEHDLGESTYEIWYRAFARKLIGGQNWRSFNWNSRISLIWSLSERFWS